MTINLAYLPLAVAFGLCVGAVMIGAFVSDNAHGDLSVPDRAERFGVRVVQCGIVGMCLVVLGIICVSV